MKIIKPGKIPDPNSWEGKCHYCKCEFECTDSEKQTHDDPREQVSWVTARCPTCDADTYVKLKRYK